MKIIILLFFLFISILINSQNNYYLGYQSGFKYGCQCNDLPIKNVALIKGTYDQGYLDGKVDGLIFVRNKSNTNKQINQSHQNNYNLKLYTPDFDMIERALVTKQTNYNLNREKVENYINSIKNTIQNIRNQKKNHAVNNKISELFLLENAFYKDLNKINNLNLDYSNANNTSYSINILNKHYNDLKNMISDIKIEDEETKFRMNQILTLYNSYLKKDITVKNGWHLVYVTNNKDLCEIRRVYVINNKINKYIKEGSKYVEWSSEQIEFNNEINNCKTTIKLKTSSYFVDVYFINYLSNPNENADAPKQTGKVNFWTNYGKEKIYIYVENEFVGALESFFSDVSPNCGQEGTIVFTNKEGTYNYVAVSDKYKWSGTITIYPSQCTSKKLLK